MHVNKFGRMKTLAQVLAEVDRADVFLGVNVESVHTERFSGETALHFCAKWGDVEAIHVLVANGADINKPGEDNNTPLHYAAMLGQFSATEVLVSLGAANTRDRYGNLPFDLAAGHPEVKALLLSRGYAA
jgi:ankyrin repeat protein